MTNEIIAKYEARALDNSMSLAEVAATVKIAESTISRWRAGQKPRGSTLRKLDSALAAIEAGRAS